MSSGLTRHPEPWSPFMISSILPSLICAATLVFLAVAVLIYALHRVSRSAQRSQAVQPPAPRRPSVLTPRAPAAKPAANRPYARIPHLLTPAEGNFFAALIHQQMQLAAALGAVGRVFAG